MSGVGIIASPISCGSFIAEGSGDVFINGMPVSISSKPMVTGHGPFPPSVLIGPFSESVFVNDSPVSLVGKTKIQIHRVGKSWHDGTVVSGTTDVEVE